MNNNSVNVLYVILARGGSKGLPGKNLLEIDGISLLGYKAISAQASKHCSRLIISSDDSAIQNEGKKYGAEVLFDRPEDLANDTATSDDALLHAVKWINDNDPQPYDAVMLLEPPTPFISHKYLDRAVELLAERNAYFVTGVTPVAHPRSWQGALDSESRISEIVDNLTDQEALLRQRVSQEYKLNGAFFLLDWTSFMKTGKRYCDRENSYGVIIPEELSVNIDTQLDFDFAGFLVEQGRVDTSYWKERLPA